MRLSAIFVVLLRLNKKKMVNKFLFVLSLFCFCVFSQITPIPAITPGSGNFTGNVTVGTLLPETISDGCPRLQDASHLCLLNSPYYGSGSSVTTTTVGSTTSGSSTVAVASCTSFLAGQGIYIAGAGTSGTDYIGTVSGCNSGLLILTVPTGTTVANGTKVQHDNSAALQSAINTLSITGGEIFIPNGFYRFNGPLQSSCKCIVVLPVVDGSVSSPITIKISGGPEPILSYRDAAGADIVIGKNGTILQTDQTGTPPASLIGLPTSGMPTSSAGFSWIEVILKNLTFRTYDNPQINPVNCGACELFIGEHLTADTGVVTESMTLPSHTAGVAFTMPLINNGAVNILNQAMIQGYYYAVVLGEHVDLDNIFCQSNVNCLYSSGLTGTAILNVRHLLSQSNVHALTATGAANINVESAQIQVGNNYPWTQAEQIYDPSNLLHGTFRYNIYGGALTRNGGLNITYDNIQGQGAQQLTDTATITWNAGAPITEASVTLGGNRTLSITNALPNSHGVLYVTQDTVGSRVLTLPAHSAIRGGTATSGIAPLSMGAGLTDKLWWDYDGYTFWWDYATNVSAVAFGNVTLASGPPLGVATPDPATVVSQSGGTLSITPTTTAGTYNGVQSAYTYNFTGHALTLHLTAVGTPTATVSTGLLIGLSNSQRVYMETSGGNTLRLKKFDSGFTQVATAVYSNQTYWRFCEGTASPNCSGSTAGTIYADTSPDGVTWTNLGSTTVGWSITSGVSFGISVGADSTTVGPSAATFVGMTLQ